MTKFVKDRHKAFADVLNNDSLEELKKYSKKYGMKMPKDEKVAKAGVLKAIQECTDFTEDEKLKAMFKCIDLGFKPFIS